MECGHTYFKHVYRKCVVCNTLEKMNIKIGPLIIHVNTLSNIASESHRIYCFPHLDKQTQQNTAASLQKSQPFTKCW